MINDEHDNNLECSWIYPINEIDDSRLNELPYFKLMYILSIFPS